VTVAAWLLVVIVVAGATGWLYLLRGAGVLAYGPDVAGALPLQQLDGTDGQPALRLVAAWVPAGALCGVALRAAGVGSIARLAGVAVLAGLLLMFIGAVSDAATVSGALSSHLSSQVSRAGTWVAVALMVLGVAAVRGGRPAGTAAPSGR
jgi:hypothetical protein